jgi:hypothetical protein
MASADPLLIAGEVVAHEGGSTRVRLDGGRVGFLPETSDNDLRVGDRRSFRIDRTDDQGHLLLSIASPPTHSFDREFDRLHDALANHGPHNLRKLPDGDALGEKRIEQWVGRVDQALGRLRKRRSKRSNDHT